MTVDNNLSLLRLTCLLCHSVQPLHATTVLLNLAKQHIIQARNLILLE